MRGGGIIVGIRLKFSLVRILLFFLVLIIGLGVGIIVNVIFGVWMSLLLILYLLE